MGEGNGEARSAPAYELYESYVALRWQSEGWVVKPTGETNAPDFGADLLIYHPEENTPRYALQCKYHSAPVGVDAVQQVYAAAKYYGAREAMIVTNQTLTAPASELAEKLGVKVEILDTKDWKKTVPKPENESHAASFAHEEHTSVSGLTILLVVVLCGLILGMLIFAIANAHG